MDILSFLLSLGGFGLSVLAILTAKRAKAAVADAVKKANIQKDIPEIGDILKKLSNASSAASIWLPGAVEDLQVGRNHLEDLKVVRSAVDALAIWVPADLDTATKKRVERERETLRRYCDKIADPDVNENHWNGVVVSTQSLTRILREHSRSLENSQLALDK